MVDYLAKMRRTFPNVVSLKRALSGNCFQQYGIVPGGYLLLSSVSVWVSDEATYRAVILKSAEGSAKNKSKQNYWNDVGQIFPKIDNIDMLWSVTACMRVNIGFRFKMDKNLENYKQNGILALKAK